MVMETPSPQCVGLEFVRQYYTVLNKAPLHLHRFFSHNSSFMHGGHTSMSEPIIGQADIHKMIVSLNFRDCHAKIRMVDAQATLGDGVVIQVTGELSNNGNPMRRFMQTFVLAPQTPKKYYVHNDIFRYQDEVFSEEEGGEEAGSEPEEDMESPMPPQTFTTPTATVNGSAHPPEPQPTPPAAPHTPVAPPVPTTPVPTEWGSQTPQTLREVAPVVGGGSGSSPPTVSTTTAVVAPPLSPTPPEPATTEPSAPETPPTPEKNDGWGSPDNWVATADPQGTWDEPVPQKETPDPDPPQPDPVQQPAEPKTFANLFKSSNQGFAAAAAAVPAATPVVSSQPPPSQPAQPATQQTQPLVPKPLVWEEVEQAPSPLSPVKNRVEVSNRTAPPSGTNHAVNQSQAGGGFTQRNPRNIQGRAPPRDRPYRPNSEDNSELESLGGEERRRPMPDSQQIFVGNLPHTAGEEELKAEFSKFGKIVDIRINTAKGKTGPKGQVPNFGFITFEEENAVARALNCRPIHLNGEHRLNVEEKKARQRMDGGMGRPNSGRGGMGGSGLRQGPPGGLQGRGGGRPNFNRDSNRGGPGGPRGGYARR